MIQIWEEYRRTYGARRIRAELGDAHGRVVTLTLVRSIMREQGMLAFRLVAATTAQTRTVTSAAVAIARARTSDQRRR